MLKEKGKYNGFTFYRTTSYFHVIHDSTGCLFDFHSCDLVDSGSRSPTTRLDCAGRADDECIKSIRVMIDLQQNRDGINAMYSQKFLHDNNSILNKPLLDFIEKGYYV